jgi:uncharacterized protein (TIGR02996 family)
MAVTPPIEVLQEFLFSVHRLTTEWEDGFDPVLRGSLLLQHWYGKKARPAADIDFECFIRPDFRREDEDDEDDDIADEMNEFYGPVEGRFGSYGEFVSRVDLGKAMCRYSANAGSYDRPGGDSGILFSNEFTPPEDGASLWVYGTPGRRYYAHWQYRGNNPASGRLQLDLSSPGAYSQEDLGVQSEEFTALGGNRFPFKCYSREAMLATKVSWLMRSMARSTKPGIVWTGEPKDLFDAHLILSQDKLEPDVFQKAFLAVGSLDNLNWNNFDILFDVKRLTIADETFKNWPEFAARYPKLVKKGPVELWEELIDGLTPLLGDLYPQAEMPLLLAINANPEDHLPKLVYADWLDERNDPRGPVLRKIVEMLQAKQGEFKKPARTQLARDVQATSRAWLNQLFGTTPKLNEFLGKLQ